MAEKDVQHRVLSIEQAIKIALQSPTRNRVDLMKKISAPNYYTLCRLGIITEGATVDEHNNRIAVWRPTLRAKLFQKPTLESYTKSEQSTADLLVKIDNNFY